MLTSTEENSTQLSTISTNFILASCHACHKPMAGVLQVTLKLQVSFWLFIFNLVVVIRRENNNLK